jgi:hypothetical protein
VADGGAHISNHRSAVEKSPSDPVPREGQMALGRKRMTHDHGSEYQVRIVHEDETEELNGWMNSPEKVAQAIAGLRASPVTAYWLQIRNIVCLNCLDNKLTMVEFPLTPSVAENARFPRQTERRPFGSASSRTSSAGE